MTVSDELHDAIQSRIAANRPDRTPPIALLRQRKRTRGRRRAGGAVLLGLAAALAVAAPSVLGLSDRAGHDALVAGQPAGGVTEVRVCDSNGPGARCQTVTDSVRVADLDAAFRHGPQGPARCPYYDQIVWRLVFVSAGGETVVDVPSVCGSTVQDSYAVTGEERRLVTDALTQRSAEADTNRYLDRLYECLNRRGYAFTKGADGGWSGAISGPDVQYEQAKAQFDRDKEACNAKLGVTSTPGPAPS
jgi:hypothetical protein